MKYVVIQEQDGTEFPVFCVAPQSHAQLATAWRRDDTRKVVAAGFCEFLPSGVAIVFGFSHSLNLGTRPKDAGIITAHYLGTVEMARVQENIPPIWSLPDRVERVMTVLRPSKVVIVDQRQDADINLCGRCLAPTPAVGLCGDCLRQEHHEANP